MAINFAAVAWLCDIHNTVNTLSLLGCLLYRVLINYYSIPHANVILGGCVGYSQQNIHREIIHKLSPNL